MCKLREDIDEINLTFFRAPFWQSRVWNSFSLASTLDSRLILSLIRCFYINAVWGKREDKILSVRRAWAAVLKTKGVITAGGYEEREIGRWRYKRSSAEITETSCSKFQPLPIFSSIETVRAITSSIRDSSHRPSVDPLFLSERIVFNGGGARRWWCLCHEQPAAARTGHAWTNPSLPQKKKKGKLNTSNLTFVLLVQCAYLRII